MTEYARDPMTSDLEKARKERQFAAENASEIATEQIVETLIQIRWEMSHIRIALEKIASKS